jgi:hypothetical protein
MPQSLSQILLHVVFSTKNRRPWIDEAIRADLHAYLAGTCRAIGSDAYRVGAGDDLHNIPEIALTRCRSCGRFQGGIERKRFRGFHAGPPNPTG